MSTVRRRIQVAALVLLAACADPTGVRFGDLAGQWGAVRYVTIDPVTWESVEWFAAGRMTDLTIDVSKVGTATIVVTLPGRATPIVLSGALDRDGAAVVFLTPAGPVPGSVFVHDDEMTIELPSLSLDYEDYGVVMILQRQQPRSFP